MKKTLFEKSTGMGKVRLAIENALSHMTYQSKQIRPLYLPCFLSVLFLHRPAFCSLLHCSQLIL